MRVEQQCWSAHGSWAANVGPRCEDAQLVLAFGAPRCIRDAGMWYELRARWPNARIVGCSTAGEIAETHVRDDSLVATALSFERSRVSATSVAIRGMEQSANAGRELSARLEHAGLRHVLVLSEGLNVNGSELVRSLTEALPAGVAVTGGLAGDGSRFQSTAVALDERAHGDRVVAIGFYGAGLRVGFGSLGGWDPFGPERRVTGEGQLGLGGEDAHPRPTPPLPHHEGGLGVADLPGDGLHQGDLQPLRRGEDRERVAGAARVREDVDGDEGQAHAPLPYHTAPPRETPLRPRPGPVPEGGR